MNRNNIRKSLVIRTTQYAGGVPVYTERKLNVHKTFNLRPVSTGVLLKKLRKIKVM